MKKQLLLAALTILTVKLFSQVTVTGGATATYSNVNAAFAAINAGTHTGAITIDITASTTEPVTPTPLAASGQGAANYTSINMRPSATATVSGAMVTGRGVLEFDGADNVIINGDMVSGPVSRDLTIVNTASSSVAATAAIRLIGRTTLGLGATNYTITNCKIVGSTPGNDGISGSTIANSYGIYAGANAALLTSGGTGDNYDNITIDNNEFTRAYFGVYIGGTTLNTSDNVSVTSNVFGSATTSEKLTYRGIEVNNMTNSAISQNEIFDLKATSSINNAGIGTLGTSSNLITISRNKVHGIWSTSTGGWGAYGINLAGGNNMIVTNNVVYDIMTTNYNSTSTTYQAYGIRITTGTGHKIYYNSVHLYGSIVGGSTTNCYSAALLITSTTVTGLEIKNNIFSNKQTSTVTTPRFYAVYFPAAYNFLNASLNNNAYMVTNGANHFVGRIGITVGTGEYATLSAWAAMSQVNNVTNDNASVPPVNTNAPFIADNNLNFANNTITPIESGAVTTTVTGIDHDAFTRPKAGTNPNTNPDMGAYEFDGLAGVATDAGISALTSPAANGCYGAAENIVVLIKNYGTASISNIPVTVIVSGAATQTSNATYSGTITAGASANFTVATVNMLTAGNYSFNATTTLAGDLNAPNDALPTVVRTVIGPQALPTAVNFTGFTGANLTALFPLWNESIGATVPTGTTSSWLSQTGLNGVGNITARVNLYGIIRNEWIVGPKFTASANSQISFDAAITAASALTTYSAMGSDDKVMVMVSTDCGVSYSPIYTVSATNSLTTSFTNFTVPLGTYAGQNIIVAFLATDGPVDDLESYDFHLDNINLYNASATDAGVNNLVSPLATGCYTGAENVVVSIKNYGSATISNIPVTVTISGVLSQTLNATYTGTIGVGSTANFTVGAANMSIGGVYSFTSTTGLAGDVNTFNDITIASRTANPVISILGNTSLCTGGTSSLSAGGAATSYTWSTGSNSVSITVTPSVTSIYTLTASNGTCTSSKTATVTVTNPTITANNATACLPNNGTLTATAFAPVTWYATPTSTTALATGNSYVPTATTTTTYYAEANSLSSGTIAATMAAGNGSSGNMFDIVALNTIEVNGFDVHISGTTATAVEVWYRPGSFVGFESSNAGWTQLLTTTVTGMGTGNLTYIPTNFSVTVPAGQTYGFYVTANGGSSFAYTNGTAVGNIHVQNSDLQLLEGKGGGYFGVTISTRIWNGQMRYQKVGCTSPRVPATLSIGTSPTVTAVTSNTTICAGSSATLIANGATTYSWNTGATTQGIIVTPTTTTSYTVTGTQGVCSSDYVIVQNVSTCTGIDQELANNSGVIIFPNPNNGIINVIVADVTAPTKIEILDALGRLVMTNKLLTHTTVISASELSNGVYVYRIVNSNGVVKQGKLVKE